MGPFIETPFIPIEIEKLQENKRRGAHDYSMSSAMLVGPKSATGSEKPTMYSTVINSHTTAIKHETPQPRGLGVHPAAAGAFAVDPAQTLAMHEKEINQVPSGAYSIPVQMNAATHVGDGFETPNFMHKKEKSQNLKKINQECILEVNPQTPLFSFNKICKKILAISPLNLIILRTKLKELLP